jgi:hypothetical protein|tara:strand:+ start:171 stop:698 length:528 start_codon:yes stop_codon:yes gene_type:complete
MVEDKIKVFDNKVDRVTKEMLEHSVMSENSNFRIGWRDTDCGEQNIHSVWSHEFLSNTKILSYIQSCIAETDWFTNNILDKIIVNLVKSDDVHHIHTHRFNQVALYYINLNWQDGWYGETLFFDKFNTNNIVFASSFVPGRIVLFDGDIPHSIRPQSRIATKFRMTLSLFYISKR